MPGYNDRAECDTIWRRHARDTADSATNTIKNAIAEYSNKLDKTCGDENICGLADLGKKPKRNSNFVIFAGTPCEQSFEEVGATVIPYLPGDTDATPTSVALHLRAGVVRSLLSSADVIAIKSVGRAAALRETPSSFAATGRRCWQADSYIKETHRIVYDRIMEAAWGVDSCLWQRIFPGARLYPEIEYEELDARSFGRPVGAERDGADEDSALSAFILLSNPKADFQGGAVCLEGITCDEPERKVKLQPGDALFFRGDACRQWIASVEGGSEAFLQLEFCYRLRWGTFFFMLFCFGMTALAGLCTLAGQHHSTFYVVPAPMLVISGILAEREIPPWLRRSALLKLIFLAFVALLFVFIVLLFPFYLDSDYANA